MYILIQQCTTEERERVFTFLKIAVKDKVPEAKPVFPPPPPPPVAPL